MTVWVVAPALNTYAARRDIDMDVVYPRVCGLDVHKKNVVTCVITPDHKQIQTFSTMTEDLLALVDWIQSHGCTPVAMEGNKKLRNALVEASRGAARSKNTYLSSLYHRLAARRGANRAAVAVAHRILTISYHLLKDKQTYIELGPHHYEERKRKQVAKQAVRKLEALGYTVTVEETQPTAS
jgi:hypothetical protein